MHRIIGAMRGRAIRLTLASVLVLLALPALAGACESWTPPPGCYNGQTEEECLQGIRNYANERGIGGSGIEAARIRTAEEHFQACEKYEKEVAEIHERGERERAENNLKYEERLHEIAEQQKREEQQQAEAKYAREHPTPPSTPQPVAPPPSVPTLLPRFEGEIEPRSGSHSGHRWRVGSKIKLQLLDRRFAHTRYRVSINWSDLKNMHSRSFWRVTGAQVEWSSITITAPQKPGHYSITWTVMGTVVARWKFDAVR
jgi:hypothetical protein